MIELKNLKKVYHNKRGVQVEALKDVNLTLPSQGLVFIVGKSGSGKSTLLNLLGALDQPTTGEIDIDGKKLNKKLLDAYRNQYVGFIFQEFYLFDEYSVYDNICLALKLQRKKPSKKRVHELLEHLGIEKLEHRKPNELSGGERQRVAIARALIKNPHMILADEPTGNLDVKSSEQIFNILKAISVSKLVVVVSHDLEFAKKYGDRIIEISDGRIVQDVKITNLKPKISMFPRVRKSRLPFLYRLKMVMTNLKAKPLRLFMTTLLLACSFIFTAFMLNASLFDETKLVIDTMKNNQLNIYKVEHRIVSYDGSGYNKLLTQEDQKEIEKKTKRKVNPIYQLKHEGELLKMPFLENDSLEAYYQSVPRYISVVEVNDEKLFTSLIGNKAKKEDEIVISQYMADGIIKIGLKDAEGKEYQPQSYEQIVTDKHSFLLGENKVHIVGIIRNKSKAFEDAKKTGNFSSEKQYQEFLNEIENANLVYTKGFVEHAKLTQSKESVLKSIYLNVKNTNIGDFQYLKEPITVVGKDRKEEIKELNKNDMILSFDSVLKLYPYLDKSFQTYMKEHQELSYQTLQEQFIEENKDKIFILDEEVLLNYGVEEEFKVKVRGISFTDNNYISLQLYDSIPLSLKECYSYFIYENDYHNMEEVLRNMRLESSFREHEVYDGYAYQVPYMLEIQNTTTTYHVLYRIILIVSLVFLVFTLLLFTNFITTTISYSKKKIGILRALGAKRFDITRIFALESFFISLVSYGLSMIGFYYILEWLNQSSFPSTTHIFKGFYIETYTYFIMFLYSIVLSVCITILSLSKVLKIKPIDAIRKK